MMRQKFAWCCLAVFLASFANPASAHDNVADERKALEAEHDKVIYLKEIGNNDYIALAAVLPAGPAGVGAYLEELIASILKETGQTLTKETVYDMLMGKKDNTIVGDKPVYVGILTYNHWTEEKYPKIHLGHVTWGTIKVPHPNTHQFYVAIGKK